MGKQRTNISVDAKVLGGARARGMNVSAIAEEALRKAQQEAWQRENAEALQRLNDWVDQNGLPLADYQVLKVD
ncbi:MAG: type II toxin-antitoxin system CcdA family antitoxin [Roseicyclus sp.]|nr:type II toxin-antitoxin system CcdA family antitoxin [Roseicyclus sp.]